MLARTFENGSGCGNVPALLSNSSPPHSPHPPHTESQETSPALPTAGTAKAAAITKMTAGPRLQLMGEALLGAEEPPQGPWAPITHLPGS